MSKKILLSADVEESELIIDKSKSTNSILGINDVYFYSEINNESTFVLNKSISDLGKQLLVQQINFELPEPAPIKLYINSDGGEVFGALSTIDRINRSKVPIHSYVEGLVASAATLISVSCHKRYMSKNSIMMIHQIRSWFSGTYENFKDESENLDTLTNIVKSIYLSRTKFTNDDLNNILKRDVYLTSADCLKFGLVDVII
jgi:ATP-dependent Clp endopeptidase proteolytic subunit ClpP